MGAALIAVLATGCLNEQRYVQPEGGGPWLIALTADTPPYLASDDGDLYLVEQRIELPLREPTEEEMRRWGDVGELMIPFPRLPFVARGDLELQLDFTLSHVEVGEGARPVSAAVVVNGFNEFDEYVPEAQIIDDELVIDFSGWERVYDLQPGQRVSGTVREEELDEIAVDLATVVNGAPNPNQIHYFENQSANDARSQAYIPDVVPALTGVRVGIRSQGGASGPTPLALEVTLRVRENRQILVDDDEVPWTLPTPALFSPATGAP